jgi:hypothetical protein
MANILEINFYVLRKRRFDHYTINCLSIDFFALNGLLFYFKLHTVSAFATDDIGVFLINFSTKWEIMGACGKKW